MSATLDEAVSAELLSLAEAAPEAVRLCAARLAARGGAGVEGVLFYGSALRGGDLDGVLDFYVIVDTLAAWRIGPVIGLASHLMPPYVEFAEIEAAGRLYRAKVAVLTVAQFAGLVRPASLNTTVWARFSQPTALVWSRDGAARTRIGEIVAEAVRSAAGWAYALGPASGTADDYWRALFARTYRAELRVERHDDRAAGIVATGGERYGRMLLRSWTESGLDFRTADGKLARTGRAPRPFRGWWRQALAGKPLNLARLVKAAFTFKGGPAYLAWKIERHSGVRLDLTPWQHRHPVLAAPTVLWRLWRRGVVR